MRQDFRYTIWGLRWGLALLGDPYRPQVLNLADQPARVYIPTVPEPGRGPTAVTLRFTSLVNQPPSGPFQKAPDEWMDQLMADMEKWDAPGEWGPRGTCT